MDFELSTAPTSITLPYSNWELIQLYNNGENHYRATNYLQALEKFEEVLQLEPHNHMALFSKASSLYMLRRFEESNLVVDLLIKIAPYLTRAFEQQALNFLLLKNYSEAIASATKSIELDPNNHTAINAIGSANVGMRKYKSALEFINRAIEIEPNIAFYHRRRGHCMNEIGEYKEAAKSYQTALDLAPNVDENRSLSLHGIALSYHRSWYFSKAVEMYEKAIEVTPDKQLYYNNKSKALFLSCHFLEAFRVWRIYLNMAWNKK